MEESKQKKEYKRNEQGELVIEVSDEKELKLPGMETIGIQKEFTVQTINKDQEKALIEFLDEQMKDLKTKIAQSESAIEQMKDIDLDSMKDFMDKSAQIIDNQNNILKMVNDAKGNLPSRESKLFLQNVKKSHKEVLVLANMVKRYRTKAQNVANIEHWMEGIGKCQKDIDGIKSA